jgi:hypothetical protein
MSPVTMMMAAVARSLVMIAASGLLAVIPVLRGRSMAVPVVSVMVGMTSCIPRGRAMAVMLVPAMVLMTAIVRGIWMRMVMTIVSVAAGSHSAHCEKGDSSGKLLMVLQRKQTLYPCHLNQPLSFGCIISQENWKMLRARLK